MFVRDPCLNGQLCPDENNILWQFSFTDMAQRVLISILFFIDLVASRSAIRALVVQVKITLNAR